MRPSSSISISGSLTADPPAQSTPAKARVWGGSPSRGLGRRAGAPAGVWGGSPSGVRGSAPHEISTKKGIKSEQFSTFLCLIVHSLNNTFTLLLTTQHSSSTAAPIQNETLTACGDLPKLLWGLCTLVLLHSSNHAGQCFLPVLARCPSTSTRLPASYNVQRDTSHWWQPCHLDAVSNGTKLGGVEGVSVPCYALLPAQHRSPPRRPSTA